MVATSRHAAWSVDVATLELRAWPIPDALRYLRRETGRADNEESDARALAEAVGALPLALAHAAAYLRGNRIVPVRRYLARLERQLESALDSVPYPSPVFGTFQAAIVDAERRSPGAAAILCFAAQFAPESIPEELFRQSPQLYPPLRPSLEESGGALHLADTVANDMRIDEALGALDRLSLARFSQASSTFAMHRLVQLSARELVADSAQTWIEAAIHVAGSAFPQPEFATGPSANGFCLTPSRL